MQLFSSWFLIISKISQEIPVYREIIDMHKTAIQIIKDNNWGNETRFKVRFVNLNIPFGVLYFSFFAVNPTLKSIESIACMSYFDQGYSTGGLRAKSCGPNPARQGM